MANPVFIPLGGAPSIRPACGYQFRIPQNPFPRLRGKVAEGRKGGIKPQRLPRLPQTQYLSRLTSLVFSPLGGKPSIRPAWWAVIILPYGVFGRTVAVARGIRLRGRRL